MPSNKKRKCPARDMSYVSQLYNASSLANEVTEHSNTIEKLKSSLELSKNQSQTLSKNIEVWKDRYQKWKASSISYQQKDESNQVQMTSLKAGNDQKQVENEKLQQELANMRASSEEWCETLKAGNDQKQVENEKLQQELANMRATSEEQRQLWCAQKVELHHESEQMRLMIVDVEKKLHETKRECIENRARKKTWKKKYEELANMGAIALAKVTKESYGVTPEQFQAFKSIADIQFKLEQQQNNRTELVKTAYANKKALKDQ